ncbi:hypothetical protein A9G48_05025 [Gilliamella sp. wkB18]|uniref:phage tail-collar fiber domain-containing protein n=1 Tax=Gilliamella sp. wkB18 TaxID=3120260 RepID=UPI00080DA5CD|nr:phage tail protein [Gilliamella apicola]OCG63823.1 hypothetical protein A9G48_05025 [Gilliamella apicola]
MSKTAIVKTGEQFFIKQLSKSQPIKLDRVIFANISGINGDTEIDLNGSMPDASQIVHTAPVTQSGLLNDKTVVYSVILDTSIGDFSFNYIGLVNAETNTLCMVMHTDLTRKIKTAGQRQGNTITESIWLEIDNASESTGITVNAQTWQIDYSKRLAGEDERIRLTNYDLYNRLAIHSGFTITKKDNKLTVSAGLAYVAGLRVEHTAQTSITVENNQSLYVDAWLSGTTTGEWSVNYNLIAGTNLKDYETNGFKHYVERVASVDASGKLVVVKAKSFITTYDHSTTEKMGIVRLSSATNSTSETEAATPLAIKTVNDLATENHNNLLNVISKFTSTDNESVVFSPNHNYQIVMRNDGVCGVYNHLTNKFAWLINQNGGIDGYIGCDRVVGLDEYVRSHSLPVGIPQPWPTTTPPPGWLKCNGWKFDKNRYPRLAHVYPSGNLPDLRGEFIRGWDDGKNVDPGRGILSWQRDAIRNIHGSIETVISGSANHIGSGAFYTSNFNWGAYTVSGVAGGSHQSLIFDASRVAPTAHDNRPRNLAFMYIVKAE